MKLRIIYLFCCAYLMVTVSLAQQSRFKNERRIYLWDVTLSMKGEGSQPTPNIYDKVVDALQKDINSINDEQTEILVLPFQTSILDCWKTLATSTGKKSLIDKIKGFNDNNLTKTNIALPMEKVMTTWIKPDKRNVLILLTDGIQNATPKQELIEQIQKWCRIAEKNDAHAFYVMLTQFAQDEELIKVIDETCRMSKIVIDDDFDINFVELLPQSNYKYNIKDDAGKKLSLQIEYKKNIKIPEDLEVLCYCEPNPYVDINQTATIKNNLLEIAMKQKQCYDSLKVRLPQNVNEQIMVHFEMKEPEKHPKVQLLNDECTLELINKPEKTLKVYVKD